jgi:hypothetical protein
MSNPNPFQSVPPIVGGGAPMTVPTMPSPMAPVPPAEAKTPPPSTAEVATEKAAPADGVPGFTVQLKDNPELFIPATEAHDRMAATEVYMARLGILHTIHPFTVVAVVRAPVTPAE